MEGEGDSMDGSDNDMDDDWKEVDNLEDEDFSNGISKLEDKGVAQVEEDNPGYGYGYGYGGSSDDNSTAKNRNNYVKKLKVILLRGKIGDELASAFPQKSKRIYHRSFIHFIPRSRGGVEICSASSDSVG
ncbi:hypothetical protein HHI36_011769, partial [Cryptolaemus montrouzieri]